MSRILDREYAFFNPRKDELTREHPGEYVVISGERIIGFLATEREAYEAGLAAVGNVPMLIELLAEDRPVVILSLVMTDRTNGR